MVAVVQLPDVRPMLASAGPLPSDTSDFVAEPKVDGFRSLVFMAGDGGIRIRSRTGRDLTASVPELAGLAGAVGADAILDGELVVLGADARPDFYALGPRLACTRPSSIARARRVAPVSFLAFDVLWLRGEALAPFPYRHRREVLESLSLVGPTWATIPSWSGPIEDAFVACAALGLEGIVVKSKRSSYTEGRSRHWVKLKTTAWKREHAPRRRPGASVRSC